MSTEMARCKKGQWMVMVFVCALVMPVAINLMGGISQLTPNAEEEIPPKYILYWTPFFANPTWYVGSGSDIFKSAGCSEQRCIATTDKTKLPNSSLVLFNGQNLVLETTHMPQQHNKDQLWLFYTMETPQYTWMGGPKRAKDFDGLFSVRGSYRRDSDLYTPYNKVLLKDGDHSLRLSKVLEMVRAKSKLALWFVSNCHPSERQSYAAALAEYNISIDIFGRCGRRDPCRGKENPQCLKELKKKYKFYLSFENHKCKDYITEKFYNALSDGMVPVVLGASQADYEAIAPPDSFLHVDNFTSPMALARYMRTLDRNEKAYTRYLLWHKEYQVGLFGDHSLGCKLCHLAHNTQPFLGKTYPAAELWNEADHC